MILILHLRGAVVASSRPHVSVPLHVIKVQYYSFNYCLNDDV